MKKQNPIKFAKPCLEENEDYRLLTPQYALDLFNQGRLVQVNLDNCSIQRMEQLPNEPTLKNVDNVGLMPLVALLNTCPVALTAMGVNEMPDRYVKSAQLAYESFCHHFWPGHKDDYQATQRQANLVNESKKVDFRQLSIKQRCAYGSSYISMLLIQKVKSKYAHFEPEKQFEVYLHGVIGELGYISAFELELAKYAFWGPSPEELNYLPDSVLLRRKNIHINFCRKIENPHNIYFKCFDSAMDIHWLSASNLSENFNHTIDIYGKKYLIDNWVGTTDEKLFQISQDIYSVYVNGLSLTKLASVREYELSDIKYWQYVDSVAHSTLLYRNKNVDVSVDNLVHKIDSSVYRLLVELNGSVPSPS